MSSLPPDEAAREVAYEIPRTSRPRTTILDRALLIAQLGVVLAAIATAITCFVAPWYGGDTQIGSRIYHGLYPNQTSAGRWFIAVCFAAVVWAVIYIVRRNLFTALAGVALAVSAAGFIYWATAEYGFDEAWDQVPSVIAWFALAVAVAVGQWWKDGHERPLVLAVFGDFAFRRFLTTSISGLVWVLSMTSGTVAVAGVTAHTWWEESFWYALLVAPFAAIGTFLVLLLVRLSLELAVVMFRIYEEL